MFSRRPGQVLDAISLAGCKSLPGIGGVIHFGLPGLWITATLPG